MVLKIERKGQKMKDNTKGISEVYLVLMAALGEKYGRPSGSYFLVAKRSGKYRKNNKISRTKEGLYIHHVGEYTVPLLSNVTVAEKLPFGYQEPDMLVYCDAIEHLLAHVLIVEALGDDDDDNMMPGAGVGGVSMLVAKLNDWFDGHSPIETNWERFAWEKVKGRKAEYKKLLARAQRAYDRIGIDRDLSKVSERELWLAGQKID